ncbi:MAG: tetratricopeptide repeat protein [Zoogloeaceae bacterium]|jgi:thioredoxin-like negative regulator of GroEL|nr:tetratricopeptide repeat protein [Zoogloeaceae bacterium]
MTESLIDNTQLSRLVDVGLAAAHLGKPGEARAIFENLLAYRPGHAPARIGLAFTYLVCNDFEKAQTLLSEALAENPQDGEALALLGLAQSFAGKPEDAARTLERVPAASPASRLVQALSAFAA